MKTHVSYSIFFFVNRVLNDIMWKIIVEPDRWQMTIWCMRIACWIPKTTDTLSGCTILKLFHCNNGSKNVLQRYVICTVPVLLL